MIAAAAKIECTIVNEIYRKVSPVILYSKIGNPTGKLQVELQIEEQNGQFRTDESSVARTARLLMDGNIFVL